MLERLTPNSLRKWRGGITEEEEKLLREADALKESIRKEGKSFTSMA
jgi:hypothetical protein